MAAVCAGLSGGRSVAEEPALVKVTYCHAVADDAMPKDRAEAFYPDQPVVVSVELQGRPRSGVVGAGLYFQDQLIAESQVDVEETSRVVISTAGNARTSFQFKLQGSWPQGASYRTKLTFDGRPLGSFPFQVLAPRNAIDSRLKSWRLSKRGGSEMAHEFGPQDRVELTGTASLGADSWLQVEWKVAGAIDQAGTREVAVSENKSNAPFAFSFLPNGGWPLGMQEVILTLNGREVARERFTIRPALTKVLVRSAK